MSEEAYVNAVYRAFSFHPWGMGSPRLVNGGQWVYGPCFIVPARGVSEWPAPPSEDVRGDTPGWQVQATRLLSMRKSHYRTVEVSAKGHAARQRRVVRKGSGDVVLQGSKACSYRAITSRHAVVYEVAYPLYTLGRKAGAVSWKLGEVNDSNRSSRLCGYNQAGELSCILAPKQLGELCEP